MHSYLRFAVSGLSGSVVSATLRVRALSALSTGYRVFGVADDTWLEKKITYASAPPAAATATGSSGAVKTNSWTSIDVTPLVTGNGDVDFELAGTSSTALSLASREAGANAPQLLVTTAPTGGDTTPPTTPALALTLDDSNGFDAVSGTTFFYNPNGASGGAFTVTAQTDDPESGIAEVDFPAALGNVATSATATPYAAHYVWAPGAADQGAETVTAKNGAGLVSPATFALSPDSTAPTVAIQCNLNPCNGSYLGRVDVSLAAADGTGSGVRSVEYTTDGSDPATSGTAYTGSFSVDSTTDVRAVAVDNVGNVGTAEMQVPVTPADGDPVIAAAGDIACDPTDAGYNGGSGSPSTCNELATSNLLVGGGFTAVLTLGDNQYEAGALTAFQQSFDQSWGRLKPIIHPSLGNHEYGTKGAAGYFSYFGAAAGPVGQGYYSFDIDSWHLIALNANCAKVGGCGAGSPEEQWLRADLATHPGQCTLAFWHQPHFSTGTHGNDDAGANPTLAFWQDLYAAHADLVLNGHDHDYERFALQDPAGNPDPNGIREIVVGTGGRSHTQFHTVSATSEIRDATTYGVLELTLHSTSYDWRFVPAVGAFTDAGSQTCHSAPPASP